MKKQLKRAIICAISMIVVGVMCLTGVTYAWFTDSKTAIVEGININSMTAVGGILLSTDPHGGQTGEDWAYSIKLFTSERTDFKPASTHPSTIVTNDGKLKFYDAELDPENPYSKMMTKELSSAAANASVEGHYIEKTIYLNNILGQSDVTVTLENTTIGTDNKNLNYATRIAIVDHGSYYWGGVDPNVDPAAEPTYGGSDAAAAALKASAESHVQIYENDALKSYTGTERSEALPTYGVCGQDKNEYFDMYTERAGIIKLVTNQTDPSNVKIVVPAGKCEKITIYVWIEGQDADCLNQTSGAKLTVKVGFTLVS